MNLYVGVTDSQWFEQLKSLESPEDVNFWQPGGRQQFRSLLPGELFLFKLHHPDNFIVGGGVFAHSSLLPISLAWEAFGLSNGAKSFSEMRAKIAGIRRQTSDRTNDFTIGCIILEQPFFLPKEKWIPVPSDWKLNIVQGKRYDTYVEPGRSLYQQLQLRLTRDYIAADNTEKYGKPHLISPRLGQGSFRVMVTDAYERRCAVSKERTLPALDAAHIIPYSESGQHVVNNGILLRRDIHALFDQGYLTISPEHIVEVSGKIKEEFDNGRDYYKYHGQLINLPVSSDYIPSPEYLEWHNTNIYKG
jgi:putative restriction endonuclease